MKTSYAHYWFSVAGIGLILSSSLMLPVSNWRLAMTMTGLVCIGLSGIARRYLS